jgi:diaminopimelate decarboxylase
MDRPRFLTPELASEICHRFGTPIYVYDEKTLKENAAYVLAFPNAFGLTARYAMKAAPNAAILQVLDRAGLHIDASYGIRMQNRI